LSHVYSPENGYDLGAALASAKTAPRGQLRAATDPERDAESAYLPQIHRRWPSPPRSPTARPADSREAWRRARRGRRHSGQLAKRVTVAKARRGVPQPGRGHRAMSGMGARSRGVRQTRSVMCERLPGRRIDREPFAARVSPRHPARSTACCPRAGGWSRFSG